MKLLAIDPGSQFVGLYWGVGRHRTLVLGSVKKPEPRPERLAKLANDLADFLNENGPFDFCAYEEQFVRGGAATKALFGAVGVIEALLTSAGTGVVSVPQSSLRKWAKKWALHDTGPKALYNLVARVHDPRSVDAMTEHEHDACALYWYSMSEMEF